MAFNQHDAGSKSINVFGGIVVGTPGGSGAGTAIKRIDAGTFTANTTSVPLSSIKTQTFTLVGATTGDMVFLFASTALDTGLSLVSAANVTATSTVTAVFVNETTAAIVQTSGLTNRYLHIKL